MGWIFYLIFFLELTINTARGIANQAGNAVGNLLIILQLRLIPRLLKLMQIIILIFAFLRYVKELSTHIV